MIQDTWPNMQDPQWMAALLDSVSESTINGIVITDLSGHVIWVNAAFTKISGYQLNEMKGKKPGRMLQGKETDAKYFKAISSANLCRHRNIKH